MHTSQLLAQFWGYFTLSFGLVFLIRPKAADQLFEFIADEKFMFATGFISFVMGLVNIILHNLWVADWRVIITLFGWTAALKGITRIGMFPGITGYAKKIKPTALRLILLFISALGGYLLYCAHEF